MKAGFLNCTRDSPAGGAIGAALLVLVLVVGRMLYDVMLRLSVPISGYGTGARAEIRPPPPWQKSVAAPPVLIGSYIPQVQGDQEQTFLANSFSGHTQ